jgi:hypothetical protein
MKRAVSISIGTSKRDKAVEIELLGERIRIERIGTDGDMERAARLYQELDGKVDAFGVGGADLGVLVDQRFYPLYSVQKMVRFVRQTPLVDGEGLKNTIESGLAQFLNERLGDELKVKHALIPTGADRWGMATSFAAAGYECVFGDLMFGLGLPIPLRSTSAIKRLASIVMPIAGRLPFDWIYPTGEKQEERKPKWQSYYAWASVIAGDAHYIKRHMPDLLTGKVIATNTTTDDDVDLFRRAGVRTLVTSTPRYEGRSFGTNMMEAALVAVAGQGRKLTHTELAELIRKIGMEPQLQRLN